MISPVAEAMYNTESWVEPTVCAIPVYTPVKSPDKQEPDPPGLANEIEEGQPMNAETEDTIGGFAATDPATPVDAAAITNAATRVDARGDTDFKLSVI